jgi:hypothetical protein
VRRFVGLPLLIVAVALAGLLTELPSGYEVARA